VSAGDFFRASQAGDGAGDAQDAVRNGRRVTSACPGLSRPAMLWILVVSSASSDASGGKIVGVTPWIGPSGTRNTLQIWR
jgi:hypothetical protein